MLRYFSKPFLSQIHSCQKIALEKSARLAVQLVMVTLGYTRLQLSMPMQTNQLLTTNIFSLPLQACRCSGRLLTHVTAVSYLTRPARVFIQSQLPSSLSLLEQAIGDSFQGVEVLTHHCSIRIVLHTHSPHVTPASYLMHSLK